MNSVSTATKSCWPRRVQIWASSWVVSIRRMGAGAYSAGFGDCRAKGARSAPRNPLRQVPIGGVRDVQAQRVSTMKSVYFPVSLLMPWSETISEAPAQSRRR